jgi:hypothetical protein
MKCYSFCPGIWQRAAYGSAREAQLRRLEPMHNNGLRIAIGACCVCKTETILCVSGFENLAERRRRKFINKMSRKTINLVNISRKRSQEF